MALRKQALDAIARLSRLQDWDPQGRCRRKLIQHRATRCCKSRRTAAGTVLKSSVWDSLSSRLWAMLTGKVPLVERGDAEVSSVVSWNARARSCTLQRWDPPRCRTEHLIHLTRGDLVTLLASHTSYKLTEPAESLSFYFEGNFHTNKEAAFFFFPSCGRNRESFPSNRKLKFNFKIIKTRVLKQVSWQETIFFWGTLPSIYWTADKHNVFMWELSLCCTESVFLPGKPLDCDWLLLALPSSLSPLVS